MQMGDLPCNSFSEKERECLLVAGETDDFCFRSLARVLENGSQLAKKWAVKTDRGFKWCQQCETKKYSTWRMHHLQERQVEKKQIRYSHTRRLVTCKYSFAFLPCDSLGLLRPVCRSSILRILFPNTTLRTGDITQRVCSTQGRISWGDHARIYQIQVHSWTSWQWQMLLFWRILGDYSSRWQHTQFSIKLQIVLKNWTRFLRSFLFTWSNQKL